MKALRKLTPIRADEVEELEEVTIEELYQDYGIIPEYDESKECMYLEDPDTDEAITPCFQSEYELMRYVNDHWDQVGEILERIRRNEGSPDDRKT
jgi:hypothetical protein